MPRKDRQRKGPPTAAQYSALGRRNSQRSPWRKDGRNGSERQRACLDYFEALARQGDTRRVPRPELDQ